MKEIDFNDEEIQDAIRGLIAYCKGDPESFDGELVRQMIETSLKLMVGGHDTGQLKLVSRALKEMRYAYRIFNEYKGKYNISIFGSARTPEGHPDYLAAKEFSAGMAEKGWMCITGAANGIMKAGLEGTQKESSFGLSIRLPFEAAFNSVIEGDPKLITFRYFFTRKLMFLSHSHAVAVFPGGYGTLDELFEVLTLVQTGKSNIMPIVLIEGKGGNYWKRWEEYVQKQLLKNHWISPEDRKLYYHAKSPVDAIHHIIQFYRRFHSYRYVKDYLVIRLKERLSPEHLEKINQNFSRLVKTGKIEEVQPYREEEDHMDLFRIAFIHTRRDSGLLRMLIDEINR